MSQKDTASRRGTRDIETELAHTRLRIDHTLELLQDRFRPSVVVDQAWRYARSKSEDGTATRLQETVARNPLPVALMGVGLAWLLLSGHDGSVPQSESPLTEGASGRSSADGQATDRDEARPAAANSAHSEQATGATRPVAAVHSASDESKHGPDSKNHSANQSANRRPESGPAGGASASAPSDDSTQPASRHTRPADR